MKKILLFSVLLLSFVVLTGCEHTVQPIENNQSYKN